ncbi:hypothetical protein [Herbidospora mongoliensis]|uniref:hypothetical protein n=1 Tax=Herbidospora mongoliensis TaxID=688067 RepID=UPI000AE2CBDB|nr:hypothetical protein [Herbidospora mongoliensis]
MCWNQARTEAKASGESREKAIASNFLDRIGAFHQLFFAGMLITSGAKTTPQRRHHRRGAPRKPPPTPAQRPQGRWIQPKLFDPPRDFTRFNEDTDADPTNPWLIWGIYLAHQIGEAHGWRRGTQYGVRRGLTVVLSGHDIGDVIRYSELFPAMRARDISVERVAEVLTEMGLLRDGRIPSFENWLKRKLDGLADGIHPTEAWLRTMREGGPRTRPRDPATAWTHMGYARPTLLAWSQCYDHLREVTRDDVLAALEGLTGSRRSNLLISLRSLFAFAKKTGKIFRNPTRGIRVGQHHYGLAQRLDQAAVHQAAEAATTPAARLVLMLDAVHAARTGAIRELLLDDVDLGNRQLTIAGRARPIDEFSHQILLEWLDYRRTRWPSTANPHLLINQMSAHGTGPVSTIYFAKTQLRGQAATLERLRVDRQLEEALTHGPDPLHLAAVFGLDPKTAIRYAENARALLVTLVEEQDPASRDELKGPQPT